MYSAILIAHVIVQLDTKSDGRTILSDNSAIGSEFGNPQLRYKKSRNALPSSVGQVILGKANEIRLTTLGLLCRGHILLEDIPGVGKTMLAKSMARAVGCTFNRIQFTPDMLPSDITGVSIYNPKTA